MTSVFFSTSALIRISKSLSEPRISGSVRLKKRTLSSASEALETSSLRKKKGRMWGEILQKTKEKCTPHVGSDPLSLSLSLAPHLKKTSLLLYKLLTMRSSRRVTSAWYSRVSASGDAAAERDTERKQRR